MDSNTPERDLYALLQVPRDANDEEIRNAYRRLALTFHPDHHPSQTEEAKQLFIQIRTAYDTLIDDRKRKLYDNYGLSGVKISEELQLLERRYPATEELLKAFERIKRKDAIQREELETVFQGETTMEISAEKLIKKGPKKATNLPKVANVVMHQSVKIPLSQRFLGILGGTVHTSRGKGAGALSFCLMRHDSNHQLFSDFTLSNQPSFRLGGWAKTLGNFGIQGSALFTGLQFPSLDLSVSRDISNTDSARVRFGLGGEGPNASFTTNHFFESFQTTLTREIWIDHGGVNVEMTASRPISKKNSLKVSGGVNMNELSWTHLSCGATHQLSKLTRLGLSLKFNKFGPLILVFNLARGRQKFSLPILLGEVTPKTILVACVVSLICVTGCLFLDPWNKAQQKKKEEEKLQQKQEEIEKAKKEAERAVQLIANVVSRKLEVETAKKGLIIVMGRYGLDKEIKTEHYESQYVVDVTVALQYLVSESHLRLLSGTSKSQILGFYDPCPDENKLLYIRYLFEDVLHEWTFGDRDEVSLPMHLHKI